MDSNFPHRLEVTSWFPIIGLAFAAFVFNTSEFLPVGLLPDIAGSLGETVSFTGLMITGYAWVVAVMSLPLTIATATFERRKLLLFLIACFALAHIVVLWVGSFATLLAARVAVALTHSVFWSIMTPLAARMAPRGRRAVGLAAVMGGSIVATVMGIPIGTKLGQMMGWQDAFFVIGVAAMVLMGYIYLYLPPCPASSTGSLKSLPVILKRPALLQLYFLTVVTVLGHFTVYSYIAPILQADGGYGPSDTVLFLFIFGISGIIGTFIMMKVVDRHVSASLTVPLIVIAASLFLLYPACANYATTVVLLVIWGAAMTSVMLAFQTVLLNVAPDAADIATSIYSGIFNVGIGGGAFVGSLISEAWGFHPLTFAGGSLVVITAGFCLVLWIKSGSAVLPVERVKTRAVQPAARRRLAMPSDDWLGE